MQGEIVKVEDLEHIVKIHKEENINEFENLQRILLKEIELIGKSIVSLSNSVIARKK